MHRRIIKRGLSSVSMAVLGLAAASALAQKQTSDFAYKYVAADSDVTALEGWAIKTAASRGRIIFGGTMELRKNKPYSGPRWRACSDENGKIEWAARLPEDIQASDSRVETNGDEIWASAIAKSGVFQLARFEAKSLQKEASAQLTFDPTSLAFVAMHSATDHDFDLQTSIVQTVGRSIRVALFSRDLHLVLDKIYSIPADAIAEKFDASAGSFTRIPDRSGYHIFLRYELPSESKPPGRIGIIRLDNAGAVKWANTYSLEFSDSGIEPQVADDGSILVTPVVDASAPQGHVVKIGSDGSVNWGITIKGVSINLGDNNHPTVPYHFSEPLLLAHGMQMDTRARLSQWLFGINYQTGKIERQMGFHDPSPGAFVFMEKGPKSFYVSAMNVTNNLKEECSCSLLQFDYDFNLRAARHIRKGAPVFTPFRLLPSGKGLLSFPYRKERTFFAEAVDENLEGVDACQLVDKATFTSIKSNYVARSIPVPNTPLSGIIVSDAKSTTGQAEFILLPLDLKSVACATVAHR
jgi:hypothetical protein